jgi:hypothetical protein
LAGPCAYVGCGSSENLQIGSGVVSKLPIDQIDEAIFAVATKVTVHNGRTAKFWQSSWIDGCSLAILFPSLFQHSTRKQRTVKDALHNENWIRDIMLWILIDAFCFNNEDSAEDEIIWLRTSDGNYSARSVYELQFEGSQLSAFSTMIWKTWAPARCKLFT